MSNIAIAYDNIADGGTYSGGSWAAALPLTNLKTYDPKQLARSTNATEASTVIICDLGYAAPVDVVALINTNLTDAATLRVRVGPNADGSSALIDMTLTAGDFGTDTPAAGRAIFYLNSATISARYVRWDISDESNPDGYVQFGRHIVGTVFQPDINIVYGAQIGLIDESRLSRAVNGAQYADIKPKRRRLSGAFDALTSDEAFGEVYDLQSICGTTVPVLAIYDPQFSGDALQRTSLYATVADLQSLTITQQDGTETRSAWQVVLEERN